MEKKVISASRTKDVVRNSPEQLALILKGEANCRLGYAQRNTRISLDEIHTLVLWSKTPFNILENKRLCDVLTEFVNNQGLIALQLTVTGLAPTFIEYDIPHYTEVAKFMKEVFDSGLIFPEAVMLRYDPFCEIEVMPGYILSNMQISLFSEIVKTFSNLGVRSFATSRMDPNNYPYVHERIEGLGLEIHYPSDSDAKDFVRKMDEICKAYNVNLKVCCDPDVPDLILRQGCIKGKLFNTIHHREFPQSNDYCTEELHNNVTKGQRPNCQCTYSQDIGYSKGFVQCYPRQSGCIYCYSQRGLNKILKTKILAEIETFKENPEGYMSRKDNEQYQKLLANQPYGKRTDDRTSKEQEAISAETQPEQVNLMIRKHESAIDKWEYSGLAKELYDFFDLFNQGFFERCARGDGNDGASREKTKSRVSSAKISDKKT